MARSNLMTESICKIRKRRCSSNSSSSSVLKNHRLKRALLVGRRSGVSTTPVPIWKMVSSPSAMASGESPRSHNVVQKAKRGPVSTRKLAATLWEMNDIPHVHQQSKEDTEKVAERGKSSLSNRDRKRVASGSSTPHSMNSEIANQESGCCSCLRKRMSSVSQRYKYQVLDYSNNANVTEIEIRSKNQTSMGPVVPVKRRAERTGHSSTCKEFLKILDRIWSLEDEHSINISLVPALRAELKKTHLQIDRLVEERRSHRREIESMEKRFAMEKATWRNREQERIQVAVLVVRDKLETERKLRKRTESLNKTLGRELADTKGLLTKALKELASERKVRRAMEKVCDELAWGITEDREEVEELKRESTKEREEMEREREMLQLADLWREERVQMKLADAKFHLEEKNAALDELRNELETFLKMKKMNTIEEEEVPVPLLIDGQEESDLTNQTRKDIDRECDEEGSSDDGDLHSIELNKDRIGCSYRWNCVSGVTKKETDDSERLLLHSNSLSFDAGNVSKLVELDVGGQENGFTDQRKCWGSRDIDTLCANHPQNQDYDQEIQRYKFVKSLRDQVMADSKVVPASPT